jgi:hypothetical protein
MCTQWPWALGGLVEAAAVRVLRGPPRPGDAAAAGAGAADRGGLDLQTVVR